MQILSNILAFLVAAGVVIFVHEAGHYLAGKLFGVRVLVFSLGFGKRIWGFRRGDTDYRIALIPLGGYVSFDGQDPTRESDDPGWFQNHPRWQRILIYLAGPAMNVLLAILLVAVVFMWGTDLVNQKDQTTEIGMVFEDLPAQQAGLQPGDRIVSIDGEPTSDWQQVSMAFLTAAGRELEVVYQRGDQTASTKLTPVEIPRYKLGNAGVMPAAPARVRGVMAGSPADRAGLRFGDSLRAVDGHSVGGVEDFQRLVAARPGEEIALTIERSGRELVVRLVPEEQDGKGLVGIYIDQFPFQRFPPGEALVRSARYNWDTTIQIFEFIGKVFEREIPAESAIGGPIEIARLSGVAARRGLRDLLYFMALISLNIGILNMAPIPILDGGQIGVLLVESTLRRDLSIALKERILQAGLLVIVALMAIALYFDLMKSWPTGG